MSCHGIGNCKTFIVLVYIRISVPSVDGVRSTTLISVVSVYFDISSALIFIEAIHTALYFMLILVSSHALFLLSNL